MLLGAPVPETCAAQGSPLDLWARHCGLPSYAAAWAVVEMLGLKVHLDREEATRNSAPRDQRSFTTGREPKTLDVIRPDVT